MGMRATIPSALAISLALHVLLLWPDGAAERRRPSADLLVRLAAQEPAPQFPAQRRPGRGEHRDAAAVAPPAVPSIAADEGQTAPATLAQPSGSEGTAAEGMRRYRFALALAARPFKPETLPALAGTADVRVNVGTAGKVDGVALLASSGSDTLDTAAVGMIERAAGRAEVPEALRGRAFVVDLPVIFSPERD